MKYFIVLFLISLSAQAWHVKDKNVYMANINIAGLSMGDKLNWISCSKSSSIYTCKIANGTFKKNPKCYASVSEKPHGKVIVNSISSASIMVRTYSGSVPSDRAFTLMCK